jgi:hypothetical protein
VRKHTWDPFIQLSNRTVQNLFKLVGFIFGLSLTLPARIAMNSDVKNRNKFQLPKKGKLLMRRKMIVMMS